MISLVAEDTPATLSPIHRAILDRVRSREDGWWHARRFVGATKYTRSAAYRAVCELRRWGYLRPYDKDAELEPGRWYRGPLLQEKSS